MYNIEFYQDKNGKSEILEYIEQLQHSNSKADRIKAKKISLYVDILSRYGLSIGEPYIKHVYNKIWELRPIRDRILFTNICNRCKNCCKWNNYIEIFMCNDSNI